MGMAPIAVYEVASFYNMYDLAPVGRHKVTVCTNLPCALSGGVEAAEHLKSRLGVDFNETTADGRFSLEARSGDTIVASSASGYTSTELDRHSPSTVDLELTLDPVQTLDESDLE